MNLKKSINNKRGSYLIEATISLPIFIISVLALALLINIITICEGISFNLSNDVHEATKNAYELRNSGLVERLIIQNDLKNVSDRIDNLDIEKFKYLYESNGIDDLIATDIEANFSVLNPIGIEGKISFNLGLLARGFTGKYNDGNTLRVSEFESKEGSKVVVIFPRYGERYHTKNCRYVKQDYGDNSYHIEMEREDAKRKGYTACKVCLGGDYE